MVAEFLSLRGEVEARVADGPFSTGLEVGRFRPDVLLVDLKLGNLDPIRLARLLKADSELARIGLLGVLAFPDPRLEERARDVGYARVLHKPVSLDALGAAVQELLVNR